MRHATQDEHLSMVVHFCRDEIANRVKNGHRVASKEEADEATDLLRWMYRTFRSGGRIKRKYFLEYIPSVFRLATGQSIRNLDLPDSAREITSHDNYKHMRTFIANGLVGIENMRLPERLGAEQAKSLVHYTRNALWSYNKACAYGAPSVFEPDESLVSRLIDTDPPTSSIDIRFPLGAFCISLPKGAVEYQDPHRPGTWLDASFVSVAAGREPDGRVVLECIGFGEPCPSASGPDDDAVHYVCVDLSDGSSRYPNILPGSSPMTRVFGRLATEGPTDDVTGRLCLNFMAYLASQSASIKPDGANRPWHEVREILCANPKRTRVVIGKRCATWYAKDSVKRCELSATDILVRGHWRNQAHGSKRQLRRLTWIEPHVRRQTDETPLGHDYVVREAS